MRISLCLCGPCQCVSGWASRSLLILSLPLFPLLPLTLFSSPSFYHPLSIPFYPLSLLLLSASNVLLFLSTLSPFIFLFLFILFFFFLFILFFLLSLSSSSSSSLFSYSYSSSSSFSSYSYSFLLFFLLLLLPPPRSSSPSHPHPFHPPSTFLISAPCILPNLSLSAGRIVIAAYHPPSSLFRSLVPGIGSLALCVRVEQSIKEMRMGESFRKLSVIKEWKNL